MDIPFPRGVRDLAPNEALFRNELLRKVEAIFQRFGFLTIDTPSFEPLQILHAKDALGEQNKLIYEMKDEDIGLRYDHTVSFARYLGMHNDQPLPFKRYVIGKVWRLDEPQKNRYREITMADIDIAGGAEPMCDAEVLCAAATALDELGVEYTIRVNDRRLMDDLFSVFKLSPDAYLKLMRTIDKLDKLGVDKMNELLLAVGIPKDAVDRVNVLLTKKGSNEDKMEYVEGLLKDKSLSGKLRTLLQLVENYNINGKVEVDLSLVRGLDYYTGIVFEIMDASGSVRYSIGGGGRYDNLVEVYSGRSVPVVGISLGIDRIMDVLNYQSAIKQTYAKVFVAYIKDSNYPYALKIANTIRAAGINCEINLSLRNISNQMNYANSMKFQHAVILGDSEEKEGRVKLRDLATGEETSLSVDECISILKKASSE
jgi:histidyl-tRNA synthetase